MSTKRHIHSLEVPGRYTEAFPRAVFLQKLYAVVLIDIAKAAFA